jgi:hypothetical protein
MIWPRLILYSAFLLCSVAVVNCFENRKSGRRRSMSSEISDEIDLHAEGPPQVLLLPGPKFAFDWPAGGFTVGGKSLRVSVVENSGLGTGLCVWDGAVVLAKFLESSGWAAGRAIVELGSGTGVVGLSAAVLGARHVWLTDLEYTLGNLRSSVAANAAVLHRPNVSVLELDWWVHFL